MTWVPRDLAKVGKKVTAGKDKRVWLVVKAYKIELDAKDLHTDWKAGGLK